MACFSYWSWVLPLFHDGSVGAQNQAIRSFVGKSCQYIQEDEGAAWAQQYQIEILWMEKAEQSH